MKTFLLSPFKNFKCVGGDCKHNCCLKWQINVDERTLKKYREDESDFSETLKSGVDFNAARLKMRKKRCVFLNRDNLCDIIINLGEDALCQVCADHPRYRNFFSSFTELGFGLCCEEAARELLTFDGDVSPVLISDDGKPPKTLSKRAAEFEKEKLAFRENALNIIKNRDYTFDKKMASLVEICDVDVFELILHNWKSTFLKLERLSGGWTERLEATQFLSTLFPEKNALHFEQLAYYFIHRHVSAAEDKIDLKSRLLFCFISLAAINSICSSLYVGADEYPVDLLIDVAREYSAEIEYSDDNVNALLDVTDGFIKIKV